MANKRDLKKDIDYLIFEVISDCLAFSAIHHEDEPVELSTIISDAVNLRNDLISRVNNPDGKDNPKLIRTFYRTVQKDLVTGVDQLFDRLSALSTKK